MSWIGFIWNILVLLLGLPFAVYGLVFTGLPVYLGRRKSKQFSIRIKNKMLRSSFDFVFTQILMQAAFYFVYIVLYWIFFDSFICFVGFMASCVLTRMIWQDYLHMASRMLKRMRACFLSTQVRKLQPSLLRLQKWAIGEHYL